MRVSALRRVLSVAIQTRQLHQQWATGSGSAFASAALAASARAGAAFEAPAARSAAAAAAARSLSTSARSSAASGGFNADGTPFAGAGHYSVRGVAVRIHDRPTSLQRNSPLSTHQQQHKRQQKNKADADRAGTADLCDVHVTAPVDQAARRDADSGAVQIAAAGVFRDFGGRTKFSGPASSEHLRAVATARGPRALGGKAGKAGGGVLMQRAGAPRHNPTVPLKKTTTPSHSKKQKQPCSATKATPLSARP